MCRGRKIIAHSQVTRVRGLSGVDFHVVPVYLRVCVFCKLLAFCPDVLAVFATFFQQGWLTHANAQYVEAVRMFQAGAHKHGSTNKDETTVDLMAPWLTPCTDDNTDCSTAAAFSWKSTAHTQCVYETFGQQL